jgi:hypothetical protein
MPIYPLEHRWGGVGREFPLYSKWLSDLSPHPNVKRVLMGPPVPNLCDVERTDFHRRGEDLDRQVPGIARA